MKAETALFNENINMLKSVLRQRKKIDGYSSFLVTDKKEIFYEDEDLLFGLTNFDNINLQESIDCTQHNFEYVKKQTFFGKYGLEHRLYLLEDYKRVQGAKKVIKVSLSKDEAKKILKTVKQRHSISSKKFTQYHNGMFCSYHNGYITTANYDAIKRDKVNGFGEEDFMIQADIMAILTKFSHKGFQGELHLDENNKVVLVKNENFFIVGRITSIMPNYATWFDNYDTRKQHITTFESVEDLYNNTKPKYPQAYCGERMIDETFSVSLHKIKEILKAEKQTKITLDKHTDNENQTFIVLNGDYIISRQ